MYFEGFTVIANIQVQAVSHFSLSVAPKCSLPAGLNDRIRVADGANCTEAEETQCSLECKDGYSPKPETTCSVDDGYFDVTGCTGGFYGCTGGF